MVTKIKRGAFWLAVMAMPILVALAAAAPARGGGG